jgi:hypothetical protein
MADSFHGIKFTLRSVLSVLVEKKSTEHTKLHFLGITQPLFKFVEEIFREESSSL